MLRLLLEWFSTQPPSGGVNGDHPGCDAHGVVDCKACARN